MFKMMSLLCEPLAIDLRAVPTVLEAAKQEIAGIIVSGETPEVDVKLYADIDCEVAADNRSDFGPGELIAVVPLSGVVTRHGYWAAAGTLEIGRTLQRLERDPQVGTVILSVNSPGGSVYGTSELAGIVRGMRERKGTRVVAAVDPLMASAATWIATAADEVYAVESADVGSIGVLSAYADYSKYLEEAGIKVDVIRTPEKKARFTGVEPLTDAMRQTMEDRIAETYQDFVNDMAKNRRVATTDVEKLFGGGEVMNARQGVKVGLIDGIMSLDDVLARSISTAKDYRMKRQRRAAELRAMELEAQDT